MPNQPHLRTLNLTLLDIRTALKGADYAAYTKTRKYIITQLTDKGVTRQSANTWWSRILAELRKEYRYMPPHSPDIVAQRSRAKRLKEKEVVRKILERSRPHTT
jgi:hypothetical protein